MTLRERIKVWAARVSLRTPTSDDTFDPDDYSDEDIGPWWEQQRTVIVFDVSGARLLTQVRHSETVIPSKGWNEWSTKNDADSIGLDWSGVLQFVGGVEEWLNDVVRVFNPPSPAKKSIPAGHALALEIDALRRLDATNGYWMRNWKGMVTHLTPNSPTGVTACGIERIYRPMPPTSKSRWCTNCARHYLGRGWLEI